MSKRWLAAAGWLVAGFLLWRLDWSFVLRPTGWQMGFAVVRQEASDPYWLTIAIAAANTFLLGLCSSLGATCIGAIVAFTVIGGNPVWARIGRAYVQLFRNTPLLLQAMFWFAVVSHLPAPREAVHFAGFYVSNRGLSVPVPTEAGWLCLTLLLGVLLAGLAMHLRKPPAERGMVIARMVLTFFGAASLAAVGASVAGVPLVDAPKLVGFNFAGGIQVHTEFVAALLALCLFGSAYIAEILRGGFATVPKGVMEACAALSLPRWVAELKVRVPMALRAIVLPMGNQYTILMKATSIGLAIGFTDLFAVTVVSITQVGETVPLLLLMSMVFVVVNQAILWIIHRINSAVQIPGYSI